MPALSSVLIHMVLLLVGVGAPTPLFAQAQGTNATAEEGPDQELKEFQLEELEARLRTMQPGTERDYFEGMLANRSGRIDESIELLNKALPAIRKSHPDRASLALKTLADDYLKRFEYGQAASAFDDLLTHFAGEFGAKQLQSTKDDAKIAEILRGAPAQTIAWSGPVELKTERNPLSSMNADLAVNGVRGPWLLDTGANFSVVSKSFAERMGLKLLAGSSQTTAGLTGIENPLHVALLPTLELGGATLHNVVVLVLDDANLKISLGKQDYQINAILGYPVFQALGAVTFRHDGEFEASEKATPNETGARMYMKELTPVVQCKVEGDDLPFGFDTGAASTDFFLRYYNRFRREAATWKQKDAASAGAGGTVKLKVYVQPEAKLWIGDKVVILKKVMINQKEMGTDHDELYGNLGQDVVANFESFTLDFRNMRFRLGEALPSEKTVSSTSRTVPETR
jgi:predicted aspartyl protease